ncbi:MAG: hypothetical protein PF795_05050, partial [Kiritimatiellae bacterium]|nr:hypothetical protein [Kiritimatiellia bacterium]
MRRQKKRIRWCLGIVCVVTVILSVYMVLQKRWEERDRMRLSVLQNWERDFTALEPGATSAHGPQGDQLHLIREGQQVRVEWQGKEWVGFVRSLEGRIPVKGAPFQKGELALSDYIQFRPVSQEDVEEERYVGRVDVIFTEQVYPASPGRTYMLEPDATAIRLHIRLQDVSTEPHPEWRGEAEGLTGTYRPPRHIP